MAITAATGSLEVYPLLLFQDFCNILDLNDEGYPSCIDRFVSLYCLILTFHEKILIVGSCFIELLDMIIVIQRRTALSLSHKIYCLALYSWIVWNTLPDSIRGELGQLLNRLSTFYDGSHLALRSILTLCLLDELLKVTFNWNHLCW